MRRRFGILVSTLLVLTVVAGLLSMHGFEAANPETLAAHAVHQDDPSIASLVAVGWCVFVGAVAVSVAFAMLFFGSTVTAFWHLAGGLMSAVLPVLRGPPRGFSYERCVIRV